MKFHDQARLGQRVIRVRLDKNLENCRPLREIQEVFIVIPSLSLCPTLDRLFSANLDFCDMSGPSLFNDLSMQDQVVVIKTASRRGWAERKRRIRKEVSRLELFHGPSPIDDEKAAMLGRIGQLGADPHGDRPELIRADIEDVVSVQVFTVVKHAIAVQVLGHRRLEVLDLNENEEDIAACRRIVGDLREQMMLSDVVGGCWVSQLE